MTKEARIYNGGKTVSSISGTGKNGQLHSKQMKLEYSLTRRRGWDISREQHRNMYIIYGETDHQPRLDA